MPKAIRKENRPRTVEEAADRILQLMTAEARSELAWMRRDEIQLEHHRLGRYIRNVLVHGNKELLESAPPGPSRYRPDDISSQILERAWQKLQNTGVRQKTKKPPPLVVDYRFW